MFIIRLFAGSVIGMIAGVIVLIVGLLVVFVVAVGALAVSGGPGDCTPGGGPMTIDAAGASSFKQKWDAFNKTLDGGAPASVSLSESEISSRADAYLKSKSTPLKEPRVCIHDGSGEGQATISFLGMEAKFKVKGTLDLAATHPKAKIDSIEIGNVPGWLISPAESFVNSAIDDALNGVDLDHKYAPKLTPGKAEVGGTP